MIYVFGDCELDTSLYTLRRAGHTIRMRPKVFRTCLYLVEHRDRVISREELSTQVWPGPYISDATLEGVIRLVRQAVGDSGHAQGIIQTLHGHGYRFTAAVEERPSTFEGREAPFAPTVIEPQTSGPDQAEAATSAQEPAVAPAPLLHGNTRGYTAAHNGNDAGVHASIGYGKPPTWTLRSWRVPRAAGGLLVLAFAVLTLTILGGWALWHGVSADEVVPLDKSRIAVLPFLNLSAEEDNAYFADGMTEELIAHISHIRGLSVIARTSVMRYKGTLKDIPSIGHELQVGTILEGSVRKVDNHVRISAQLIDVATQKHLWSQDYDRDLKGVFGIQRDIATQVAQQLKVQLTAGEEQRIDETKTENLEAYTLWLLGRSFRNQWTEEGLRTAIAYFQKALDKDPNYALAYASIADAYLLLPFVAATTRPMEVYPRGMTAIEQALQRGGSFAAVHMTMASAKLWYTWDWAGAEASFHRALTLSPNDAAVHRRYAWYLLTRGRMSDAIAVMHRAQELNPLSPAINRNLGLVFYFARQYDQAIAQFRATLEMDSNFRTAYSGLIYAYLQKGMYAEALGACQEMLNRWGHDSQVLWDFGYASAVAGQHDQARNALAELHEQAHSAYVKPLAFAWISIGLDDKESAFAWLDRAYAERDPYLTLLNADPVYDNLHADPRFTTLLKKIGLEQ